MKNTNRFLSLIMSGLLSVSVLAGCGTNPEAEAAALQAQQEAAAAQMALTEVNQNDYRGAIMRVESIKKALMGVVDTFNERNNAITSESPSNFWSSDSYKYLGMNLLNYDVWYNTSFFNETETTWDEAVEYTKQLYGADPETGYISSVQNFNIERVEANIYKMTYTEPNIKVPYYKYGEQGYTFGTVYEITYDANHDWAQCVRYRTFSGKKIADGLFEYARISDTEFVVQTETERLYVKYADGLYDYNDGVVSGDAVSTDETSGQTADATAQPVLHDPLSEKPIAEFYYTQLNGAPRYEYAEIVVPEEEDALPFFSFFDGNSTIIQQGFNEINDNLEYVCIYNAERDSIFNDMTQLGKDWVFADNGRFKLSLAYYDDMLVVKNENTLVNKLECTNFLVDGTTESFTEDIYVPEIILAKSDEEIVSALDESARATIPQLFLLSTDGFNFGERTSFENIIDNRNFDSVNFNGTSYDVMDSKHVELDSLDREIVKSYTLYDSEYYIDNEYALPQGRMYFVSVIDTDIDGNHVSDNDNYYTMLYEYEIQDDYTIKYNSYYLVSDNPDCEMMLQNIKPRSTTKERVESAYGEAMPINDLEILDDEGFVEYTVTYPDNMAAYRCENGIIYVLYDSNNTVQVVGMYAFEEPQSLDTVYVAPEE